MQLQNYASTLRKTKHYALKRTFLKAVPLRQYFSKLEYFSDMDPIKNEPKPLPFCKNVLTHISFVIS